MKNEALLDAVEKAIEALEAVRSELLKAEEAEEGIRIDCEPGAEVTIWPLGTGPAPEPQLNVCPNCGMPYETGSKFCMNCGTPILSAPPAPSAARSAFCMNCGEPLAPGDKFCMNCGTRV